MQVCSFTDEKLNWKNNRKSWVWVSQGFPDPERILYLISLESI